MPKFSLRNLDNTKQNEKQTRPTRSSVVTEDRVSNTTVKMKIVLSFFFFFSLLLDEYNLERLIEQRVADTNKKSKYFKK